MMNEFDRALGYYDGMGGGLKSFLKKIEKGVRTGVKSVTSKITKKIASPIAHAILPKAVRKIGKDLDKKGINKIAGAVVLSVVSGGSASSLLAKAALSQVAKAGIKSGTKDYQTVKINAAAARQAVESAGVIGNAVKALPEFQEVVTKLRGEGYDDAAIAKHWLDSKAFYETSMTTVKGSIAPMVAAQVATSYPGMPADQQAYVTDQASNQIAANATDDVKHKASGTTPLLILAGVVAAALLGA